MSTLTPDDCLAISEATDVLAIHGVSFDTLVDALTIAEGELSRRADYYGEAGDRLACGVYKRRAAALRDALGVVTQAEDYVLNEG